MFTALPLRVLTACVMLLHAWRRQVSSLHRPGTASASASASLQHQHQQQPTAPRLPYTWSQSSISQEQVWQQAGADQTTAQQLIDTPSATQAAAAETPAVSALADGSQRDQLPRQLSLGMRGDQLFDMICIFIFLMAVRWIHCFSPCCFPSNEY